VQALCDAGNVGAVNAISDLAALKLPFYLVVAEKCACYLVPMMR
jgi:hypothetical protein